MDNAIVHALLKQLWLKSDNCLSPIENAWFSIQEASRCSGTTIEVVRGYFYKLVDAKIIEKISDEPLLFQFTEIGKRVKTSVDIEKVIAIENS